MVAVGLLRRRDAAAPAVRIRSPAADAHDAVVHAVRTVDRLPWRVLIAADHAIRGPILATERLQGDSVCPRCRLGRPSVRALRSRPLASLGPVLAEQAAVIRGEIYPPVRLAGGDLRVEWRAMAAPAAIEILAPRRKHHRTKLDRNRRQAWREFLSADSPYSYSVNGERYGGVYVEAFGEESEAQAVKKSLTSSPPPVRYQPGDPFKSVMDP